ncbi:DUF4065 domain-containing protein [Corynebacterium macginleyi]|uniref:type II toxin-antitoxin system antitoxin SocA domain-containing protein n=1 Tax=Corynebacterium macginleyi TaxID=38290 RepID=UPI00190B0759|nr:DUF4065 domain-containing protein [Corynebacterium macginleyi]
MTVPLFPGPTISKRYTTLLDATSNTRLKVVKNLWAADRFSLRRFAQTITDPYYVAMKNGPVSSYALRVIKQDEMASEADLELWRNSFETRGFDICPIAEIGTSALSCRPAHAAESSFDVPRVGTVRHG